MMDFMDSLRRGVDRAGFEMDRLLRANRVRSQLNALRSQKDEEVRRIGLQVVEMCLLEQAVPPGLEGRCHKVKQIDEEIAAREAELEAINQEAPLGAEAGVAETPSPVAPAATIAATSPEAQPPQPPMEKRCHNCGAGVPDAARFCPNCGVEQGISTPAPEPEAQTEEEPAEPEPPHSPTV